MSEWQPIETAPKDGGFLILGFFEGDDDLDWCPLNIGRWNGATGLWHGCTTLDSPQPTHWVPLPMAPDGSEITGCK